MRPLTEPAPNRILVVMPSWLGDVTMATPVLRALRREFPDAWIGALVRSWLAELLADTPWLNSVIQYHNAGQHRGPLGAWRLARALREPRSDLAVVLPHSLRTGLIARLTGARRRVGYSRGDRGWLLTDAIRPPREGGRWKPVPKPILYRDLLAAFGLEVGPLRPELFTNIATRTAAGDLLAEHGIGDDERLVLVTPGANFGSAKCWLPERFAGVADRLAERAGVRVALIAGPGEERIVRAILDAANRPLANLAERPMTIGLLKALVQRCDLMICNDTGPRHVAVAFDKPVVVVIGPTDTRHTDCNLDKTAIVRKDVPCAPCQLRTCPTDHCCMREVQVDDVVGAAEELIEQHWQERS
jgi:heptosyltransferase-2